MDVVAERFTVHLVSLDPVVGAEMRTTRPCLVISPDEMNRHVRTVIIAPLTTGRHPYPSRVTCKFGGRAGEIVLDQIRTVARERLLKPLGRIEPETAARVLRALQRMFA